MLSWGISVLVVLFGDRVARSEVVFEASEEEDLPRQRAEATFVCDDWCCKRPASRVASPLWNPGGKLRSIVHAGGFGPAFEVARDIPWGMDAW